MQGSLTSFQTSGKLIDPVADKLTQIALIVALAVQGIVPLWITLLVTVKESFMIAGAFFLYGKKMVVYSKWYGKLATVLFYIAVVVSLFITYWNAVLVYRLDVAALPLFDEYIYYLAIVSTVFALLLYLHSFVIKRYLKTKNAS